MDQLAPAIAWVKKNIFWLGCGILFVAAVVMWYLGTTSLAAAQKKNESKVKSNLQMAETVLRKSPTDLPDVSAHPNNSTKEKMQEELKKTLDSIIAGWKLRVEAQKELLVWPDVVQTENFADLFNKYNPAETFPDNGNTEVVISMLRNYKENIGKHMIKLCGDDLLRTNWKGDPANFPDNAEKEDPKDKDLDKGMGAGGAFGTGQGGTGRPGAGGPGGPGGPGGGSPEAPMADDLNRFAVIWSDVNQDLWMQKLTTFQGMDDNDLPVDAPTALQCYMLQQDLWLLEAMFRIIRDINGNSNANDLSVIKRIDHIVFGREANSRLGELTPRDRRLAGGVEDESTADSFLGQEAAGGGDWGMRGDDPGDDPGAGSDPGKGGYNVGAIGKPPFHRRYVDTEFVPISSESVKNVIRGKELPDKNLELIVAKRVPVRIAVKMDERRISDFMAACANSPFAFEIQQVRINRHEPGGEKIQLGGEGEGGDGNKLDRMGNTIDGGGDNSTTELESQKIEVRTNYDVLVEFFGIVKIYNPVREDILRRAAGLETDEPGNTGGAASLQTATANPRS